MQPNITIITPSLNQGKYIEETIKSVLDQDYDDVEYIVVDGGSNDGTIDVLKKYGSQLEWISEPDDGQADAINKGFRMAKGDIISWINSDDVLIPGALEKVAAFFRQNPQTDMIYGKSNFIDSAGKTVGTYPTEPFDYERLAVFNFISQPSVFFKRDVFEKVGGLDARLQFSFDLDFWLKIGKTYPVEYLEEFLSCYRLHPESKTVDSAYAEKNHKEGLFTVLKHYNWAPLNRVYGYCYHYVEARLPMFLRDFRPMVLFLGLLVSIFQYLKFNRGIRYADIKSLKLEYAKKVCIPWGRLYKSY